MITKITCPVCDRPDIEGDICPNCETNLSSFRLLVELPVFEPNKPVSSKFKIWLSSTILMVFLLGISLGATGGSLLSKQPLPAPASPQIALNSKPSVNNPPKLPNANPSYPCTRELEYTVRKGDYLSKIAWRFYDDSRKIQLILHRNSQLKGRENELEIGDKLILPKLYRACE